MRRQTLFLMTVLLALVCPAYADDAAIRKELDADYAKIIVGFKKKEVKEFLNLMTDDFTLSQNGQTENRKQAERAIQTQVSQVEKITIKIQSLKITGDTAVATIQRDMSGTMVQSNIVHLLESADTSKDTWTRTSQGWRLKSEEILKSALTVDGKPVPPSNNGPRK